MSCGTNTDNREIVITKDFLRGEWMMDSIVGKNDWKQDWVYFTDNDKYWRFSKYNESYLIEKEFDFKDDTIFHNRALAYIILPLDSENIILDNGKEKFHCKRWMPFDKEDIEMFMKADPIKRQINGWWVIDSSDVFPIQISSWCNNLGKGTKVHFNPKGMAEIYPFDSTNNKYCDEYIYSVNVFGNPELSLQEGDMVMSFEINKVDSLNLILTGRFGIASKVKLKRQK